MIRVVEFENFRNLEGRYEFEKSLMVITGKNNSGKTNILEGIKIAFLTLSNEYCKISKSDFKNSDDTSPIIIKVELEYNSIPSLNYMDEDLNMNCGFIVIIRKTKSGKYTKEIKYLNGSNVDYDILRDDEKIPNLYTIPLMRVEDIYTDDLTTGITNFIETEEKYRQLKNDSKEKIKEEMNEKIEKFQGFCTKFNQKLNIEISEPKFSNEKVYIIDENVGDKEHSYKIGSGYKSVANIIINTLSDKYNIILIDEIENHLHPSVIRTLIRELRVIKNTKIIATTHSAVVINELKMEELLDVSGKKLTSITAENLEKLNIFLHPGRSELVLADNIILVEGYTEELLLNHYLYNKNRNWTIVNVAGVMFKPYIELAKLLNKKVIVISDSDISLSDTKEISSRFTNLKSICSLNGFKLLEMYNTLETDLYNNGFINNYSELLVEHDKHKDIYIAKKNKKTEIIEKMINDNVNIDKWHIIEEIENEFRSS